MDERTKQWLIRGVIVAVTLAGSWTWSRMELSNLAYMQFVTEKQQQAVARQQQLEANELELEKQRQAIEPLPCEPVAVGFGNTLSDLPEGIMPHVVPKP